MLVQWFPLPKGNQVGNKDFLKWQRFARRELRQAKNSNTGLGMGMGMGSDPLSSVWVCAGAF